MFNGVNPTKKLYNIACLIFVFFGSGEIMDEYLVIRNLVNEDKFEEAIKRAEEIKDEHKKSMTLCMIAEAMIYEGRKKEAILLLDEAFKIAKETKDGFWKSLSISKIAFTLAVAGKVRKQIRY